MIFIVVNQYDKFLLEAYTGGLRAWFGKGGAGSSSGGGWDRYDSSGKKAGKCGDAKQGSSYSACLGKKYVSRLRAKGGKKQLLIGLKERSQHKEQLEEVKKALVVKVSLQ